MGPPQPHAGALRSRRRPLFLASVLLCVFAAVPAVSIGAHARATADPADPVPVDKVVICHRDSNLRQPYGPRAIVVSVDSIVKEQNGHASHTGPVWQPLPDTPETWGDIIPPFYYADDGVTKYFEGLNSSEGAEIYQNNCQRSTPEPSPETTLAVVKELTPPASGKFALKINGHVEGGASAVGDQGTTGRVPVEPGTHAVSESEGDDATELEDFTIRTVCRRVTDIVAQSDGPGVGDVPVGEGDNVTCVISNTLKPPPDSKSVTPELECVLFKDGQPDTAYWGYNNKNGGVVEIPIGEQNTFEPTSANGPGKPPTTFLDGHQVGAFTTDFDLSGGKSLVWHLTGADVTASTGSEPCKATIEVRKVTVPSNDPGRFNLFINNAKVASGGHGTTSGHLRIGAGEGTVRETAEPGTTLGDYTSKVECTKGTETVSAQGTKLDATIAKDDNVVCTFTNTRKGTPPEPPQPLPPTPPGPDPPPVPPTPPGPAPQLDLDVTKSVEPETVVVGRRLTWTMIVTNRSSVAAADVNGVKVDDPRSFRTRLISLRPSQGTCRPYTCDLGRLAPGASATVIAVTEATQVGVVVDIVRVSSEEQESNHRNNVAAAIAQVVGRLAPPVVRNRCATLTVAPRVLQNGRSSVVLLTALDGRGRPLAGVRVRVRGPGVDATVTTDRRGIVRRTVLPRRRGLFFLTGLPRARTGGGMHCRTLLGVLGASDTRVTG